MQIRSLIIVLVTTTALLTHAVPLSPKTYNKSLNRRSGVTVKSSPSIHQEFTTTDTSTDSSSDDSSQSSTNTTNSTIVSSPVIHQETISIDTTTGMTTTTTSDTTVSAPVTVITTDEDPEDGPKEADKKNTKRSSSSIDINTDPIIDQTLVSVDTFVKRSADHDKKNANPASVIIYNCPGHRQAIITADDYSPSIETKRPRSNGPHLNPASPQGLALPQSVDYEASPDALSG
ncbi:hypothetical protein F4703DRAFT_1849535 [Phycomyces blakesleeanus]